jgi:hypothetical protein
MWILALPLIYDGAALVVAVRPPPGARRAASRGNAGARRAHTRYLNLVAGLILLPPAATFAAAYLYVAVTHAHEIGVGVVLLILLAGPGMLALLVRLLVDLGARTVPHREGRV